MSKVIILAAGQGSRLRPLTNNRPKCLVEIAGKSLLERQVEIFFQFGLSDITVVTGYKSAMIASLGYKNIKNENYENTNMVVSLFCAKSIFTSQDDIIISYGDIIFERRVLESLINSTAPIAVVTDKQWHKYWKLRFSEPLADAETLKMDFNERILEIGKKPDRYEDVAAQYIGLLKIRSDHVKSMVHFYKNLNQSGIFDGMPFPKMYMTSFLQLLIDAGWHVAAVPIASGWLELDNIYDYELYARLNAEGKLSKFCNLNSVRHKD